MAERGGRRRDDERRPRDEGRPRGDEGRPRGDEGRPRDGRPRPPQGGPRRGGPPRGGPPRDGREGWRDEQRGPWRPAQGGGRRWSGGGARPWQERPDRRATREEGQRPEGDWRGRQEGDQWPRPPWRERPGRPAEREGQGRQDRTRPPRTISITDLLAPEEELVAGRRPVEEAFAARREARRLLVVPERRAALDALVLHAATLRIPVVEVEGGTLTSLSGFDGHQGVALAVAARPEASIDDVLARARERSEPPFVLVLDSLEDPQNLGTLLRSAEACGVHGVIFPTRRSAPLSPAAIKASAGATEHLLLVPVDDLAGTIVDLRSRGLRLIGADEGAALRYGEADLRGSVALVVGSEERGISGALRRRLDLLVRIPMRGRVASLNAAVAGSILLFAAADQRGIADDGGQPPAVGVEPSSDDRPAPQTERQAADSKAPARRSRSRKSEPKAMPDEQGASGEGEELLPGEQASG